MPGIRFDRLVEQFVTTLERTGATAIIGGSMQRRPASIQVVSGDTSIDCLLFLWTITPGGGPGGERPSNERRIQITGMPGSEGFPLQPGVRTIVGGFHEETGTWAFWDSRRHSRFSQRSPSLQISAEALAQAEHDGIATHERPATSGREVVVAVRPDALLWYVQNGEALHDTGSDPEEVSELADATPETERNLIDTSETPEEAARRYELVQAMRAFRDARFRPAVLQAYSYRCAICGTALKLVDAAHIVPVSHARGTDEVTNGIALCRLHHGAYDTGLLGVQSNCRIVLNPDAVSRLEESRLDAGMQVFQESLPQHITTPSAIEVRPHPENLRVGLEIRQFPEALIQ